MKIHATDNEIATLQHRAALAQEHGTTQPLRTYEDGITDTLNYLLGARHTPLPDPHPEA